MLVADLPSNILGNSRALVEEEKFRKSSKRKYEVLTERLLAAAAILQSNLTKPSNSNEKLTSAIIEVTVEFVGLSSQAQLLLRGRVAAAKETTNLMHLHTMTHGTRHWTGDVATTGARSDENNENASNSKANIASHAAATGGSKDRGNPFSSIIKSTTSK
jgi:hypothetical protein